MDFRISFKYKVKPVILVEKKKVMSDIFYRKTI
jgi:hypothetical protein